MQAINLPDSPINSLTNEVIDHDQEVETITPSLHIKKRVAYSAIVALLKKLPRHKAESGEIEKRVKQYALDLSGEWPDITGLTLSELIQQVDRYVDLVREYAARVASEYTTPRTLCDEVNAKLHTRINVPALQKIVTLYNAGLKSKKNMIAGKSTLALVPRTARNVTDGTIEKLRANFRAFYQKYIYFLLPDCDTADVKEGKVDRLFKRVPAFMYDARGKVLLDRDGDPIPDCQIKTRQVKGWKPLDVQPDDTGTIVYTYIDRAVSQLKEVRGETWMHKGKHIPAVEVIARVPVYDTKILKPVVYEETVFPEVYMEEKKEAIEIDCAMKDRVKVKKQGDTYKVVNGGSYTSGEVVIFILSLFRKHEREIPLDKSPFHKVGGKVFRSIDHHVPRLGVQDVVSDVIFHLWEEMIKRAEYKEKAYTDDEMKQRAFQIAYLSFIQRLRDAKRLETTTTDIYDILFKTGEDRESVAWHENSWNEVVDRDEMQRGYPTLSPMARTEEETEEVELDPIASVASKRLPRAQASFDARYGVETIDINKRGAPYIQSFTRSSATIDKITQDTSAVTIRNHKRYIDQKYLQGMIDLPTRDKLLSKVA